MPGPTSKRSTKAIRSSAWWLTRYSTNAAIALVDRLLPGRMRSAGAGCTQSSSFADELVDDRQEALFLAWRTACGRPPWRCPRTARSAGRSARHSPRRASGARPSRAPARACRRWPGTRRARAAICGGGGQPQMLRRPVSRRAVGLDPVEHFVGQRAQLALALSSMRVNTTWRTPPTIAARGQRRAARRRLAQRGRRPRQPLEA